MSEAVCCPNPQCPSSRATFTPRGLSVHLFHSDECVAALKMNAQQSIAHSNDSSAASNICPVSVSELFQKKKLCLNSTMLANDDEEDEDLDVVYFNEDDKHLDDCSHSDDSLSSDDGDDSEDDGGSENSVPEFYPELAFYPHYIAGWF
jgi:hypothetical protein